jgi:hypothetical protein
MKNMDCKKAQRLYEDLADGRVAEPLAAELHRHLDECTDCRVLRQRAVRLQQLLTLKRHEQPPPAYFNNFLADFHQRLAADAMRPTWRQRLAEAIRIEISPAWRYGFAGACVAVFALSFAWQANNHRPAPPVASATPVAAVASTRPTVPPLAVVPAAWPSEASRPQYVLERIAITPASYETASVRF